MTRMSAEIPFFGTEKQSLHASLDRIRDAMLWKLEGLSDDQIRRPMVPSGTTLLGLVKHEGSVEFGWFCETFEHESEWIPWDPSDCDGDARIGPDETTAEVLAYFERSRVATDRVIRTVDLDQRVATVPGMWTGADVSLRWIMVHVLEGAARHAGHMDIMRELIDGQVGEFRR